MTNDHPTWCPCRRPGYQRPKNDPNEAYRASVASTQTEQAPMSAWELAKRHNEG